MIYIQLFYFENLILFKKLKQKIIMPRTSSSAKRSSAKTINSNNIAVKDEDPQVKQMKGGINQVAERLLKIQPRHQKLNESLRAIRSQGSRLLGPGSKISQSSKAKLIALYQTAQRQCENEHSTVEQLLKNIQKVREIHLKQKMSDRLTRGSLMVLLAQHASTLPLYIGKIDGHPPALVGAIPQNHGEPIGIGHFVAAYVEDVWILGEIKSQISSNKYLVRDIDDEEEEETAKQLVVLANRIIPLPHYRADPRHHAHALFSKGAIVLALYPQTTCFYKGIVETPPAGPNDDYMIAFEDPTFSTGYSPTLPVPQLYVIMHKEVPKSHHKKKTSLSPADFTDEASRDG